MQTNGAKHKAHLWCTALPTNTRTKLSCHRRADNNNNQDNPAWERWVHSGTYFKLFSTTIWLSSYSIHTYMPAVTANLYFVNSDNNNGKKTCPQHSFILPSSQLLSLTQRALRILFIRIHKSEKRELHHVKWRWTLWVLSSVVLRTDVWDDTSIFIYVLIHSLHVLFIHSPYTTCSTFIHISVCIRTCDCFQCTHQWFALVIHCYISLCSNIHEKQHAIFTTCCGSQDCSNAKYMNFDYKRTVWPIRFWHTKRRCEILRLYVSTTTTSTTKSEFVLLVCVEICHIIEWARMRLMLLTLLCIMCIRKLVICWNGNASQFK